ncbi:hypothetical protein M408DRAFT_329460, partial [Serendipita vermifera MAFF 305830]
MMAWLYQSKLEEDAKARLQSLDVLTWIALRESQTSESCVFKDLGKFGCGGNKGEFQKCKL